MTLQTTKKAAIYARISKTESDVDKVENQVEELKKLATLHGYEIIAIHTDDDISAFRGTSPRSGYISLMNGLKAQAYDVVLATEPQRLTRGSATDLDLLQAHCVKAGAFIHTRSAGVQDPATPTTKALMQIMDVIGGLEVETRIERQKARTRADLAAGLPTKGLRPFAWEIDRITVRESEAVHIRNAYKDVLEKGSSMWRIAQNWNAAQIQTDGMNRERKSKADGVRRKPSSVWTSTTVRQILVRPRNAGILQHNGEEMPTSKIAPIVSRDDFEALKIAIKGTPMPRGPKPQYLLGGLLECICGQRMHASKSASGRKGQTRHHYKIYRCRLYGYDKSRSHVTIQLSIADEAAREKFVMALGAENFEFEPFDRSKLLAFQSDMLLLLNNETQLTELLLEDIGDTKLLRAKLRSLREEKNAVNLEIQNLVATSEESAALEAYRSRCRELDYGSPDDDVVEALQMGLHAWEELPMDTRRSIIRSHFHVRVTKGGRGAARVKVTDSNDRPFAPYVSFRQPHSKDFHHPKRLRRPGP
jgi:site-specific DNA recombinase